MGNNELHYSRVYLEITNICNKSCSFCPKTKRPPKSITEAELITVLDKLSGLTEHIYFHLMGEPLLHPELLSFIAIAKERGFKPMITTNGTLLAKLGTALADSGVHKVNISLHSFEGEDTEAHAEYVRTAISFAKLAASRGTIVTLRLWNGGAGVDNSIVLRLISSAFPLPWKKHPKGLTLAERIFLEEADRFTWPDTEAEEIGERVYCHGLGDHFGILSDGSIVPCCLDREGAVTLGNAFSDDIGEVLRSERAETIKEGFRRRRAPEELCRKCAYARRF